MTSSFHPESHRRRVRSGSEVTTCSSAIKVFACRDILNKEISSFVQSAERFNKNWQLHKSVFLSLFDSWLALYIPQIINYYISRISCTEIYRYEYYMYSSFNPLGQFSGDKLVANFCLQMSEESNDRKNYEYYHTWIQWSIAAAWSE